MCRLEDKFSINPDLLWKKLGDQIVTLNVKTHQYHVLNEAAALILEQCNGEETVESIAGRLEKRFRIGAQQSVEDTRETIDGLVKLGLVVATGAETKGYARPAVRQVTEEDFKGAIASGAELACRSLLGA